MLSVSLYKLVLQYEYPMILCFLCDAVSSKMSQPHVFSSRVNGFFLTFKFTDPGQCWDTLILVMNCSFTENNWGLANWFLTPLSKACVCHVLRYLEREQDTRGTIIRQIGRLQNKFGERKTLAPSIDRDVLRFLWTLHYLFLEKLLIGVSFKWNGWGQIILSLLRVEMETYRILKLTTDSKRGREGRFYSCPSTIMQSQYIQWYVPIHAKICQPQSVEGNTFYKGFCAYPESFAASKGQWCGPVDSSNPCWKHLQRHLGYSGQQAHKHKSA